MNTTSNSQTPDLARLDSVVESIAQQIRAEFDKTRDESEQATPHLNELLQSFKVAHGRAALERMATSGPERCVLEKLADGGTFDDLSAVGLSENTICEAAGAALAGIDFAIAVIRRMSLPEQAEHPLGCHA